MKPRRIFAALVLVALCAGSAHAWLDRKLLVLYTGAATDTTAVGMADSTGMLATSPYQRLYLHLKPNKPCRVAIQVRKHGVTDSSGVSLPDSNQTAVWPWRNFSFVGVDSLALNQATAPTADAPGSDELVVTFRAAAASKWGSSRGLLIPLCDPNGGAWFHARNTSLRFRVLSASGVVTWQASLEGVAW